MAYYENKANGMQKYKLYIASVYGISTMSSTYIFLQKEADTAVERASLQYQKIRSSWDEQHIRTYASLSKLKTTELQNTILAYLVNGLSDTVCLWFRNAVTTPAVEETVWGVVNR
jgi:hypothetical protein